jgi:PD-(D/E)XK nuclease superfamily
MVSSMKKEVITDRFSFSQSKVRLYRQCHFAYHTKYVEGLTRLIKSRPLQFGIMVHEMLEAGLKGQDPFALLDDFALGNEKLFTAEKEMYGEIIEDIRLIMTAYFDYYSEDKIKPLRYKKSFAEHWFEVPVGEELLFVGKIDAMFRTPNKLRWLSDHKTFKRAPSDDDRWKNVQAAVYVKACEILGLKPFDGFMWNYIHSKPPTVPQVLKGGGLSTRDINTLPSTVYNLLEKLDLDPETPAHEKLIDRANANVKNYFFRVFTPINETVKGIIWDDFIDTAQEMSECHGKKSGRNIGMHCSWCDYRSICVASLTGGDVDFIKEREYESREERKARELKEEELKKARDLKKEKGRKKKTTKSGTKSRRKG